MADNTTIEVEGNRTFVINDKEIKAWIATKDVTACLNYLTALASTAKYIAIDTEGPVSGKHIWIQIYDGNLAVVVVIKPDDFVSINQISKILNNGKCKKVFYNAFCDIDRFANILGIRRGWYHGVVDLEAIANMCDIEGGLSGLAQELINQKKMKSVHWSQGWEETHLTNKEMAYAISDVVLTYDIAVEMMERIKRPQIDFIINPLEEKAKVESYVIPKDYEIATRLRMAEGQINGLMSKLNSKIDQTHVLEGQVRGLTSKVDKLLNWQHEHTESFNKSKEQHVELISQASDVINELRQMTPLSVSSDTIIDPINTPSNLPNEEKNTDKIQDNTQQSHDRKESISVNEDGEIKFHDNIDVITDAISDSINNVVKNLTTPEKQQRAYEEVSMLIRNNAHLFPRV